MEIKEEGGMFGLTATATTEATATTTTTATTAPPASTATTTAAAAAQLVTGVPVPTRGEDAVHQQNNNNNPQERRRNVPQTVDHVAATRKHPLSVNSADANATDTTHGNSRVVLDSNNNNDDNNNDESLQVAKAATVERGTDIIRRHLDHHLQDNPRSSFVTWIATLHPENASVIIDDRFLIPGNPWLSVYEDAIQQRKQQQHHRGKKRSNDNTNDKVTSATTTTSTANGGPLDEQDKDDKNMVYQASFLDTIVSWTLTAAAGCITVSLELVAMYFLFSIWICTNLTTTTNHHANNSTRAWLGPPLSVLTFLPFCICQVLRGVFICLNVIVLCVSIGLVELLAAVNLMLGTLFSCHVKVGWEHHQQTRRTCHLIRWAFRKRFFENVPVDQSSSSLSPSSGRGSAENTALREQLC